MSLIRQLQPNSIEEWEKWYFENAFTETKAKSKVPARVTREDLNALGEELFEKVTKKVIPAWTEAFAQLTREDCIAYVHNLTINRTYDGYLLEKSVVYGSLAKRFPDVRFEESPPELDQAGGVDYLAYVGEKAFVIQIKPTTAKSNFATTPFQKGCKPILTHSQKNFRVRFS